MIDQLRDKEFKVWFARFELKSPEMGFVSFKSY